MAALEAFRFACPGGWLTVMALLGAVIGSFLNVVVYRVPLRLARQEQQWARARLGLPPQPAARFDLCFPASHCPACSTPLRARDMLPLLSWLAFKGRARCCGSVISGRYPLTEAVTAVMFALLAGQCDDISQLAGALLFFSLLIALTQIDLRTQLLPDCLTLPLLWAGLLFSVIDGTRSPEDAIMGAVIGYGSLWSLYQLFRWATGKEALGYGDFKLLAALGAWLGWQALPLVILIAAGSGLAVTLLLIALGKRTITSTIAFGPWLALGGSIMMWQQLAGR